jgi:hypothetical protein
MKTDDKSTTTEAITATNDAPTCRRGARDRPWRAAGAGPRFCSRPGVGPRNGARPHVATGPGNSLVRPHPGAPPSRSLTGSSRSTGSSPSFRNCPSSQSPRARNGQQRWPSSPPHWIAGGYMTGTYPPSPRPLPTSPMHLTGVRDVDSERSDDPRPSPIEDVLCQLGNACGQSVQHVEARQRVKRMSAREDTMAEQQDSADVGG